MVTLTSERLIAVGKTALTTGELLKFFGALLLTTRFEFFVSSISVVQHGSIKVSASAFIREDWHAKAPV
jgi:hypothetical protein